MYIKEVHIESFANICDLTLSFAPGLNVIEGENESGKSSICMFIKFMLYGLSGRGAEGEMSERQRYVSWQTGRAAGELVVATAETSYRISRSLMVFDDSSPKERLSVIDESTGEAVFRGKVPGVAILGMDERMFVNSVFVRQIGGPRVDGAGMTEAIENILLSGDENLSLARAVDRIEKARRALSPKKGAGGRIPLLRAEEARLSARLCEAREKNALVISYENEISRLSALIEKRSGEREKYSALCASFEAISLARRVEEGRKLLSEGKKVADELASLDKYGNIGENTGRITALSARLAGIDSRLRSLRRSAGDEPDSADSMSGEEMIFARKDISDHQRLSRSATVQGVLCIAAAVLSGSFFGLSFILKSIGIVAGAAFGALALLFGVLWILRALSAKKIFKKWSARTTEELIRAVEEKIERSKAYDRAYEEWSRRGAEIYDVEGERAEVLSLLRDACSVFCEADGVPDTDILVSRALEAAEEIGAQREKLSGALSMIKGELRGFNDVMGDDMGEAILERGRKAMATDEGRTAASFSRSDAAMAKKQRDFAESALPGLIRQKGEAETALAKIKATAADASVIAVQLEGIRRELSALERRLAALEGAREALLSAGESLRSSLVPRIVARASEIMAAFTDKKYDSLEVDSAFSLDFTHEGVRREASYLSAGTADTAYVALRLALTEVLFSKDAPFEVFDESFSRVDERRLMEILRSLAAYSGQTLVFTCRGLEGALAARIDSARVIRL